MSDAPIPQPLSSWSKSQAVPSSGALASWGTRVIAAVLDGLIITAILVVGIVVAGTVFVGTLDGVAEIVWTLLWLAAAVLYYPLTMRRAGIRNGQSLGKQMMGIRVIREDGQRIDGGAAFLREIVMKQIVIGTFGSFFLFIPVLVDSFMPLWDGRNQSLHDKACSTLVVEAS